MQSMKFRVTPTAVIVSVLLAVLIAACVIVFPFPQFAQNSVEALLEKIDLPDPLSFKFGSMDRMFFQKLVFHDVELDVDGQSILNASSLELSASLQSLVKHIFTGEDVYDIRLNSPVITLDDEQLQKLLDAVKNQGLAKESQSDESYVMDLDQYSSDLKTSYKMALDERNRNEIDGSDKKGKLISSLISRTGLRLWIVDGSAEVNLQGIHLKASELESALSLKPGLEFISANINAGQLEGMDLNAKGLKVALDSSMKLSLSSERLTYGLFSIDGLYAEAQAGALIDKYILKKDDAGSASGLVYAKKAQGEVQGIKAEAGEISVSGSYGLSDGNAVLSASASSLNASGSGWDASAGSLIIASDGMPSGSLNYTVTASDVYGRYKEQSVTLASVSAKGDAVLDSLKFTGNASLYGLSALGLDRFGVPLAQVSELSLDYYITPQVLRGDAFASVSGEADSKFAGKFSMNLLCDFSFSSKEEFSGNAEISSLDLESLPDAISLSASCSKNPLENAKASVSASIGDAVRIQADLDLGTMTGKASGRLEDFKPSRYSRFYSMLPEEARAMISDDTEADLYFNGELRGTDPLEAASFFDLAVRNFHLGKEKLNFSVSFNGAADGNRLSVDKLILASDQYRLDYDGSISTDAIGIDGTLSLKKAIDASELASLQISSLQSRSYGFTLLLAQNPDFDFSGTLGIGEDSVFTIDSALKYSNASYDVKASLDFASLAFSASTQGLELSAKYQDSRLSIDAVLDDFQLRLPGGNNWNLNLNLSGLYRTDSDLFNLDINDFSLSGDKFKMLGFDLHADTQRFTLNRIRFGNDLDDLFTGNAWADYQSLDKLFDESSSAAVDLSSAEGESIQASFVEGRYLVEAKKFNLERFGGTGIVDASMLGRKAQPAYGHFSYGKGDDYAAADLILGKDSYLIHNVDSSFGGIDFGSSSISFNPATGHVISDIEASHSVSFYPGDKTYIFKGVLDADASSIAKEVGSFFDSVKKSPLSLLDYSFDSSALLDNLSAKFSIEQFSLGDSSFKPDELDLKLEKNKAFAKGQYIDASYELDSNQFSLDLDPIWGLGITAQGIADLENLDIEVSSLNIPMVIINDLADLSTEPVEDGVITGSLIATGSIDDIQLTGMLYADKFSMSVFWVPDTVFTASNASIALAGTECFLADTRVEIFNKKTFQRSYGTISAWMNIAPFGYDVYVKLPDSVTIPLWVPVLEVSLDATADVGGSVHIGYDGTDYLSGPLTLSNMLIDFDLTDKDVPKWFSKVKGLSDFTFDIDFLKNNSVCYPNTSNPILNLKINENDRISIDFNSTTLKLDASGSISLRGGEIYYFQKDFLITEGKISFGEGLLSQTGDLNISIDLRAKMRDYDSSGNKVDIYLNLQNSSLTNIEPHFTSIPSLPEDQILQMLGESILPDSVFNTASMSLSSIASVTVAAAEAVGKLGLIQTGAANLGLTNIIRDSLGLDIFSIRTNLLQNIVIDALPGSVFNSDLSPMSKYLNGTSIYAGKYLAQDIFFQTTISLAADSSGGGFISNDLKLDLEVSVDWDNPLATFTIFAQPEELSVFNLFDTMGFSVTKSIQF